MKVFSHFLLWNLGLARPWTFYGDEEVRCLERHAAGKKRLAEIGCWQGVNTSRLRRAMAPDGVLAAVDPYVPGRLGFSIPAMIAKRETAKVRNGKLEWHRKTDIEAASEFAGSGRTFDFVFSDSENSYEGFKSCWNNWSPLVEKNGIYILANSRSTPSWNIDQAGSVVFTQKVALNDPRFSLVETAGCFTVLRCLRGAGNA